MTSESTALAESAPRGLTQADPEQAAGAVAHILATGDLQELSNEGRVAFYLELCTSLGLNSLSRPFDWLMLKDNAGNERLVLYPNASCAAQLRRAHQISVNFLRREVVGELFVVVVEGRTPNGRVGQASKYVPLVGRYGKLQGRLLANAFMAAETGALRRLTLSMVGLGSPPDIQDLDARRVVVDGTGRVLDAPSDADRQLADRPEMARVIGAPTYERTYEEADVRSPIEVGPIQAPTPEELEPTRPERTEKASFRPSKRTVDRWCGAWFGIVKGLNLDDADARHAFVRDWTHGRYDSLRTFFEHASEQQAGELLEYVRGVCALERAELEAAVDEATGPHPSYEEELAFDDQDVGSLEDHPKGTRSSRGPVPPEE